MRLPNLATEKYRWMALIFLALGLAIVIIDNTVLNVAIPYILRDLNTSFDAIQWVVSGYALIIATLLITVGRLGDMFGRKRIFLLGTVFFAVGSFIASIAPNVMWLFIGEALIEAIGASMMLTSSLSLLVSEFHGRERAIAFGVWGSVAGASASLGPLLGGFLTAYYSWRWSLRINVIVAIIAILGSVFIKESKGEHAKQFDWLGTFFSGIGLFSLIFGFIEGRKFGWWTPNEPFTIDGWTWPLKNISAIPFAFGLAAIFLALFILTEYRLEKEGKSPLLKLSLFKIPGFSFGLTALGIVSMGQFGVFFILPIYLQNALGLDAFKTGVVFLSASIAVAVFGPLSGFIASKIGPKWLASVGMYVTSLGTYLLFLSLSPTATGWSLAPALVFFGIGIGMASAQLTNVILSSTPVSLAGEASAANATMRQVGTSIGIAIIGVILASRLTINLENYILSDNTIPQTVRQKIVEHTKNISVESGQRQRNFSGMPSQIAQSMKEDINKALTDAAKSALLFALFVNLLGAFFSLQIPNTKPLSPEEMVKMQE